ncbi:alpha/beta fold hydrolase [Flavobacterium sp. GT3R68]|uniref:alpha/beta fold hydrolase n=1 Tax=Flavobacterium sp. GT3R68 TaxID=2594437 RepID=UPI000F884284|nr:alpha/beta fold hydrolase [Flavobacterium sp. GT3R68]RTY87010.1 alpha/beta fold hydrolase [Flavobacterium sp. GSN2]TRW90399.1 alpha/beta fold hydrolase [Flavobacterium sp. GT3R68]
MLYSKIEGQGQPLLILHGFLGMSDNWKTLGTQYAQEFEVHMIDLRNHGRSFHSEAFDYEVMVQDIVDYCETHNFESINVLGHSMGGKVAMLFATTYPQKVKKLIVADIGPKFYPQHHQSILEGLNAVDFLRKPSRTEVEEILTTQIPDFGTRQFLMKSLYWKDPGQLAFRFNLEVFNKTIDQIGTALPQNHTFEKPTLFLRGGNSNYILDNDLDTILHHFPLAKIVTINNAGHWLHAENPKDFYQATISFLKET